jgi:hypothetical protein
MVGYFERAKRPVPESFVAMAEEALGINGELAALWKEINPRAAPKWFRAWPKIEAASDVRLCSGRPARDSRSHRR